MTIELASSTGMVPYAAIPLPSADPANPPAAVDPKLQNRYQIISQRGAGSDGIAYDAVETSTGAKVQLWRIAPSAAQPQRLQEVVARLRLVQLLANPTSIAIRELILEAEPATVVLDPCDGPTLAELVGRPCSLNPSQWLHIAQQIAAGLAAAHRLGIVGSRLNASQIFIENGHPRVDFTGLDVGQPVVVEPGTQSVAERQDGPTVDEATDTLQMAQLLESLLLNEHTGPWLAELAPRQAAGLKQLVRRSQDESAKDRPLATELEEILTALVLRSPRNNQFSADQEKPFRGDSTGIVEIHVAAPTRASDATAEVEIEEGGITPCNTNEIIDESLEPVSQIGTNRILTAGDRLGRYEICEKIGEGGMGSVFKAKDIGTQVEVAIKVLNETAATRSNSLRRFRKEARLLAAVNNPYVTRLIEVNEDEGLHYLVLEYVDGTTLKDLLKSTGPLPENAALAIAADIARGLCDAHELGIVHRDIKPENILLNVNGTVDASDSEAASYQVKVSDFGIARYVDQSESLAVTKAGAIIGTPLYMSPEQCKGMGDVTPQSDVYALGITLFEMLTGNPPFTADDPMKLAAMHCFDPAPSASKINSHVSEPVAALIAKALAKRPADRFADASHMLRDLDQRLRGEASNIQIHPALPDHDPERLFEAEFYWEMQSAPELLWPYVSNTDRLNRALGLPAVEYRTTHDVERGMRKFGSFRIAGMQVAWEEHPFEWVEGQRMGVLREFERGPFRWFASVVELQRTAEGGTRLRHQVRISPRNYVGRLLAKVEADWKARRSLDRVYRHIDHTLSAKQGDSQTADAFEKPATLAKGRRLRLQQRLNNLTQRGVDLELASQLGEFIASAPAQELAAIRPLALADRLKRESSQVLDACLYAASEGLLAIAWEVLCPTCRVAADTKASLKELQEHTYCEACNLDFSSDLANSIELVFHPQRDLRESETGKFCVGGPANFPHVVAQVRLAQREHLELELALPPGEYLLRGPQLPKALSIRVQPGGAPARCEIVLDAKLDNRFSPTLRSGHQLVSLTNGFEKLQVVRLERTISRQDVVTASAASALPLFRELFPNEVLQTGKRVSAEQVSLLVTAIHDVDQLYAELGDGEAFTIIGKHVEILETEIRRQRGAVVKTQGEGLVAAFADVADAVRAALGLQAAVAASPSTAALRLSVGVHRGAALVTSVNDRLDYFGSTARIATALPAIAAGGIVFTEEVYCDPVVADYLRQGQFKAEIRSASLPGKPEQWLQFLATLETRIGSI